MNCQVHDNVCWLLQNLEKSLWEEMHLQGNTLLTLTLESRSHETSPGGQYPLHHVNYASAKFEVAIHPRVKEEMHLEENT